MSANCFYKIFRCYVDLQMGGGIIDLDICTVANASIGANDIYSLLVDI